MSYSTGEAKILTLIRALDGYDSSNATRTDWRPLASGKAATYVVIRPGEWVSELTSMALADNRWRTVIEVWRPYKDDDRPVDIQGDVDTIVTQLQKYPDLDGLAGVWDGHVAGGGDLMEVTRGSGRNTSQWLKWEVFYDWQEEKEIAFA